MNRNLIKTLKHLGVNIQEMLDVKVNGTMLVFDTPEEAQAYIEAQENNNSND